MYATPAQLVELQKGQLDAVNSLGHTVFSAAEKFVTLNLAAAKALMQDASDTTQTLLGAKDVQELVAMTSTLSQPTIEKAVSYSRNVYGIASGASAATRANWNSWNRTPLMCRAPPAASGRPARRRSATNSAGWSGTARC